MELEGHTKHKFIFFQSKVTEDFFRAFMMATSVLFGSKLYFFQAFMSSRHVCNLINRLIVNRTKYHQHSSGNLSCSFELFNQVLA